MYAIRSYYDEPPAAYLWDFVPENTTFITASHGGQGGPTGHDILLTAVVDESMHHQALRIVEEAGGLI